MQFVCVFFYICRKFEFLISRHKGFFSTKKRWANILIAEQLSTRSYNAKHELCTTERSSNGIKRKSVVDLMKTSGGSTEEKKHSDLLIHSLTAVTEPQCI